MAGETVTGAVYHRRAMSRLTVLIALLAACVLGLAACGDDSGSGSDASATSTAPPSPAEAAGCEKVDAPQPKTDAKLPKPKEKLAAGKTYVAQVVTSCGEFDITLDAKRAPRTGGSFKYLADKGFYDGLTFHRIVAGFVIQGGDPQGTGMGGPGYSVVEAPPKSLAYTKGVVAMAKTQTEKPGTSGSQFFVVTAEDAQLPPEYALLGKVTKGLDVVDKISAVPTTAEDQPAEPVVIRSVKVSG
jgi:cyclophilin family peptidyl-prolyl cis-trans isomerase